MRSTCYHRSIARPWVRSRGVTRRSYCACAWLSAERSASWKRRRARSSRPARRSAWCAASTTARLDMPTTWRTHTAPWSDSWCPSVASAASPSVRQWFTNTTSARWTIWRWDYLLLHIVGNTAPRRYHHGQTLFKSAFLEQNKSC